MEQNNLYVILDKGVAGGRDMLDIAHAACLGGARLFQLRDKVSCDREFLKEAKRLSAFLRYMGCLLLVNDRPDIALASDAHGVHVGQGDIPYEEVRRLVGHKKLVGVSTHDHQQAMLAQSKGADYIGFGPVFSTGTKPGYDAVGLDEVERVVREIRIPVFFIGGITASNAAELIKRGATSVAAAGAVINNPDITAASRTLISLLQETESTVAR